MSRTFKKYALIAVAVLAGVMLSTKIIAQFPIIQQYNPFK